MVKSIMHRREDHTCYLCMLLEGDHMTRSGLQEHHVMSGTANRRLSEQYGLKVYLCVEHHTGGSMAVHRNINVQRVLQRKAQETFEEMYSREKWMEVFGRNFI